MRTLLAFSLFLFTSGAVADTPELGLDEDLSPDGVALTDLDRSSTVWSRAYALSLPEGVTRESVLASCLRTGELRTVDACLAPFMEGLHWVDEDCRPTGASASALDLRLRLEAEERCRTRLTPPA